MNAYLIVFVQYRIYIEVEDVIRYLIVTGVQTCALPISRRRRASRLGGTLSHQAAKRVFGEVAERGGEPRNVAEALGLVQVADTGVVAGWVSEVLGAHATEVTRYRNGETKLMPFFIGQVMKVSRGKADPKLAQRVIEEQLAS